MALALTRNHERLSGLTLGALRRTGKGKSVEDVGHHRTHRVAVAKNQRLQTALPLKPKGAVDLLRESLSVQGRSTSVGPGVGHTPIDASVLAGIDDDFVGGSDKGAGSNGSGFRANSSSSGSMRPERSSTLFNAS